MATRGRDFCGRTRRELLWESATGFGAVALSGLFGSSWLARQALAADGATPNPLAGTAEWAWAIGLSGLAVALLAPILSAVAAQGGRRKPWIGVFTVLAVVSGAALWAVEPDPSFAILALILVALGNAAFEFGQVFYNAMLPDVAPPGRLGRVSGWAWGLGYAGGLVCLALCLVLFLRDSGPVFGLATESAEQVRIIGPFVALWFAVFSVPLFLFTPDTPASGRPMGEAVTQGLRTLVATLRALPRHGQIGRFLLARMIYTDGLNTLFTVGGLYAKVTFGMSYQEVLEFGILLNITAGLGAAGFAWVDDRIGAKRTIVIALVSLTILGALILLVDSKPWFIVIGCVIGVFIGPAQAASRSLMAHLAPAEIRTEMFGLYALSGKATAWIGPLLFGLVTQLADSQRAGMATIPIFFLIGMVLLWPLKDPSARG